MKPKSKTKRTKRSRIDDWPDPYRSQHQLRESSAPELLLSQREVARFYRPTKRTAKFITSMELVVVTDDHAPAGFFEKFALLLCTYQRPTKRRTKQEPSYRLKHLSSHFRLTEALAAAVVEYEGWL